MSGLPVAFRDFAARVDSAFSEEPFAYSREIADRKTVLMKKIVEAFREAYSPKADDEVHSFFVPGRLEVFGKHTDYAGGHSLLFPIGRGLHCMCKANNRRTVKLRDINPRYGERAFRISERLQPQVGGWVNYPMTVVERLCKNFGGDLVGVDIAFGSDLPPAGGMSSSSALMIMVFLAVASVSKLFNHPAYKMNVAGNLDLAMYLACVENGQTFRGLAGDRGVGTFGGSEDHTTILNGKRGTISLYQFAPTAHEADIALPDELAYVILYSGVKARKTGGAMYKYNLVAKRAGLVVNHYNKAYGTAHGLMRHIIEENSSLAADATLAKVEKATANYMERGRDVDLPGRFHQFYLEDQEFIPKATGAFGSRNYEELARVTNLSHEASKTYLWNIAPEIEFLRKEALRLGALAASGFGAGFGGSAYALVRVEDAPEFAGRMENSYGRRFPRYVKMAKFFRAYPSTGACELFSRP